MLQFITAAESLFVSVQRQSTPSNDGYEWRDSSQIESRCRRVPVECAWTLLVRVLMGTPTFPTSYLPSLAGQKHLTLRFVTFRYVRYVSLRFVSLHSVTFRYVESRDVSGREPYVRPASRGRSAGGWLLFCVLVAGARAGRPVYAAQRLLQPTIRPSSPSQGRATPGGGGGVGEAVTY